MTGRILRGRVIRGEGWGRKVGYPTANLDRRFFQQNPVPKGIYVGTVRRRNRTYGCLAIIGVPFAWQPRRSKIELHLLGYRGTLVGQTLTAELFARLRAIRKFKDVPSMLAQIEDDLRRAKRILRSHGVRT